MLAQARAADPDHERDYVEGVAQDLPLSDGSADVMVFSYSLHHVPTVDMVQALREAHRVLRPGGTLYVVEPVAAGPGHEIVKVVDDESAVRAAAQQALRHAPELGFDLLTDSAYVSRTVVPSADALADRVVGVDPSRRERMDRCRAEFNARFAALAERVDDGYAFEQENLVKVYRRR